MRSLVILMTLSGILALVSCATVLVDADIPPSPVLREVPPASANPSLREQILEENLRAMLLWGAQVKVNNP